MSKKNGVNGHKVKGHNGHNGHNGHKLYDFCNIDARTDNCFLDLDAINQKMIDLASILEEEDEEKVNLSDDILHLIEKAKKSVKQAEDD